MVPSISSKRLKNFSVSRASGAYGASGRAQASFEWILLIAGVLALLLMAVVLLNSVFGAKIGSVTDLGGVITNFTRSLTG